MPDFTNLDSQLIASYWIYFVSSFLFGAAAGAFVSKLFFRREKDIFENEKKSYEGKLKRLEETEKLLSEKNEEIEKLKAEVSNNELYWNTKKREEQQTPGDKALYDAIQNSKKKTQPDRIP